MQILCLGKNVNKSAEEVDANFGMAENMSWSECGRKLRPHARVAGDFNLEVAWSY